MAKSLEPPRYEPYSPASDAASRTKRSNRSTGGNAERILRRRLWALGLRYRLHAKDLPGKPDIVFRGLRFAIFVDGDFWHGRNWAERKNQLARGHNAKYWVQKIAYNMRRDRINDALLNDLGWRVVRVWERDVMAAPDYVVQSLLTQLASASTERRGSPLRSSRGLGPGKSD